MLRGAKLLSPEMAVDDRGGGNSRILLEQVVRGSHWVSRRRISGGVDLWFEGGLEAECRHLIISMNLVIYSNYIVTQ